MDKGCDTMKKVKLTISGRVQGVGMRFFVNRTATLCLN